ncbi:MAG: hypothetical protein LBL01_00600, partial [Bifidobacteriaceae bacterium]|nr:hypothetical protein [Bifidobacteriaceae bacterium]
MTGSPPGNVIGVCGPDGLVAGQSRVLRSEVLIVLGVSLGASAVYAVLTLIDRLTASVPLASQTASLNTQDSAKPWLDLLYQLVGVGFGIVPALLALYLLASVAPQVGGTVPLAGRGSPRGARLGGMVPQDAQPPA